MVITGLGFGVQAPYQGTGNYLRIQDLTGGWEAGWDHWDHGPRCWGRCHDLVTVRVAVWRPLRIVVAGFGGLYGRLKWVVRPGDRLKITVWNADQPWSSGLAAEGRSVTIIAGRTLKRGQ